MPTRLTLEAIDKSHIEVTATFADDNDNPAIPKTLTWSLFNNNGQIVNSRENVVLTPAASVSVLLYGDDLSYSQGNTRYMLWSGTYDDTTHGNDIPFKDEAIFEISNLKGVI